MSNENPDARALILRSALVDWVSLSEAISLARDAHPDADQQAIQCLTLGVLVDLMRGGLLVVGDLRSGFTPWLIDTEEAVASISQEWTIPVFEIGPGDGWWFDLTPAGEDAARALPGGSGNQAL